MQRTQEWSIPQWSLQKTGEQTIVNPFLYFAYNRQIFDAEYFELSSISNNHLEAELDNYV